MRPDTGARDPADCGHTGVAEAAEDVGSTAGCYSEAMKTGETGVSEDAGRKGARRILKALFVRNVSGMGVIVAQVHQHAP